MFGSIILDLGYLSSIAMVIFCPMDSFYLGLILTFGLRCSFHLWLLLKRCFTVLQMGVHGELASRISDIFNLFVRPVSCFLPHSPWPQALPLGLLSPRPPQPPPCSHSSVQQSPCLRSKSCPLAGVEPLKAKQRIKVVSLREPEESLPTKTKAGPFPQTLNVRKSIGNFGITFMSSSSSYMIFVTDKMK